MSQRLDASLPRDRKPIFAIWWVWGLAILIGLVAWYNYTQQAQPTAASASSDIAQAVSSEEQTEDQAQSTEHDLDNSNLVGGSPSRTSNEKPPAVSSRTVAPASMSAEPPAATDIPGPYTAADEHSNVNKVEPQALPQMTINELESGTSGVQAPNKSGPIYTPASQLRQFPFSNPFARSQPEFGGLYPIEASDPISFAQSELESGSRYFIDLAGGVRTARPYSYAGQAGMGWRAPISGKWSYMVTLGAGIDGVHQTGDIALKELQNSSRSQQQDETFGSGEDISNNSPESWNFGVARIELKNNYFAYFGLHTAYNFTPNWSLRLGVETAYRFHIENEVSRSISNGLGDPTLEFFSSREVEDQFVLFNSWDLRPVAGLSYTVRPNIHLNLTYRHGTNPLLPNPIQDTPAGHARFLQLGIQFDL